MTNPKVSVIVPVYNAEKYIDKCACSLFEQTLDDVEYIFVNDCSTDRSIEVLQNVIDKYPQRKERVTIIHNNTNLGSSSSRNVGILRAKGEYVIFCDSDDFVEKCAYEEMYKLAKVENADIVACGIAYYEDGNCIGCECYKTRIITKYSLNDIHTIVDGIHSSSCNKLVRRRFMIDNKILFADGVSMWDDLYITIKYRILSNSFVTINRPYYHYILHSDSITHSMELKKAESQVRCVALINDFFISRSIEKEFVVCLMFLKFKSKESYFNENNLARWLTLYPESHKYIWNYRKYYGLVYTIKSMMVVCMGESGWRLWKIFSKIKNFLKLRND